LGRFWPKPPPSRAPATPPLPLAAQAAQHHAPAPAPTPNTPAHPSATLPSLATAPLWQAGPACQLPPLARDQAIGAFAAGHRPPHLLAINALTSSVGTMRPRSLCPSRPFTPPRLPEPSRHHFAPSPPSPATYKRTAPSPLFHHTRPQPLHLPPRAQSNSAPSSLPSPVSSALLSLVAYGQIALALKPRLSVAILAHTSSSLIAPGSLAGGFTALSARHRAMDRPPPAPSGQIGPTPMIPYPRPCFATTPPSWNRSAGGEPPRGFTGGRAPTGSPPPSPL
jgi:hypothetical protein